MFLPPHGLGSGMLHGGNSVHAIRCSQELLGISTPVLIWLVLSRLVKQGAYSVLCCSLSNSDLRTCFFSDSRAYLALPFRYLVTSPFFPPRYHRIFPFASPPILFCRDSLTHESPGPHGRTVYVFSLAFFFCSLVLCPPIFVQISTASRFFSTFFPVLLFSCDFPISGNATACLIPTAPHPPQLGLTAELLFPMPKMICFFAFYPPAVFFYHFTQNEQNSRFNHGLGGYFISHSLSVFQRPSPRSFLPFLLTPTVFAYSFRIGAGFSSAPCLCAPFTKSFDFYLFPFSPRPSH